MQEMDRNQFLLLTFATFLGNTQDMVFIKDTNLLYIAASDSFANMVGKQKGEDIVGKTDFDIFPLTLAQKYTQDDHELLGTQESFQDYIEPLPDENGKKKFCSTSKYLIRDSSGEVVGLYGVSKDVTAQIELEEERESNRMSRQMFDDVLEADISEDKMLQVEGSDWIYTLGITSDSIFSKTVDLFVQRLVHPDYREEFLGYYNVQKLKKMYQEGTFGFSHITYLCVRNGKYRWVECRSRIYRSRISDTLRITTFLKDIDDEIQNRQRLQQRASTDCLTGLYNRANVLEQIAACLKEDKKDTHALLFIDLDGFKYINDHWGHQIGDKVLQKMAERLRQLFRQGDIFGRVGGDEFVVFLRHVPSRSIAEERAKLIIQPLSIGKFNNEEVSITCSVGIAFCQESTTAVELLYEQADKAMYRAKQNGKDQIFFYDDM